MRTSNMTEAGTTSSNNEEDVSEYLNAAHLFSLTIIIN